MPRGEELLRRHHSAQGAQADDGAAPGQGQVRHEVRHEAQDAPHGAQLPVDGIQVLLEEFM